MEAQATPIQEIHDEVLSNHNVRVLVKRLDLTHPIISGNKWYKLKYNLMAAREQGHKTLLSFGGAYSNHIHALAGAGNIYGFNTIGVIRGEPYELLNPTLAFAQQQGMQLHYLDRKTYRNKNSPEMIASLKERFGDFYLVPEGGSNVLAVKGVSEVIADIDEDFDVIITACGSGGTLAGLVAGLKGQRQALGIAVLKGGGFLVDDVGCLLQKHGSGEFKNWSINLEYHFGGYAKTTPDLLNFMHQFEQQHGIPLEPVYTAKTFYALYDLIKKNNFFSGQTVLILHTGGLQGREGFGVP